MEHLIQKAAWFYNLNHFPLSEDFVLSLAHLSDLKKKKKHGWHVNDRLYVLKHLKQIHVLAQLISQCLWQGQV